MKCPHCLVEFHDYEPEMRPIGSDKDGLWSFVQRTCPSCERMVLHLVFQAFVYQTKRAGPAERLVSEHSTSVLVVPKAPSRAPVPKEVPDVFASDYKEACLVLADSPKASAALSRRCLQHILREKAGVKASDLAKEIQQVLDSKMLPTHLAESLDAIRNIGNFAAHPVKSQSAGQIEDVEQGEAEWSLDVLESLFDFFFVQPEVTKRKRAALDKKLAGAGKPPMK